MRARWIVLFAGLASFPALPADFSLPALEPGWTLLAPPALRASAGQISCTDPRGCPDVIVDQSKLNEYHNELIDFEPSDCAVLEGCVPGPGSRMVLRFTSSTPNIGAGDLIVGSPNDHPELFDFTTCHGHPHFVEYADYRLWTPSGYEQWRALRAANPDVLPAELLKRRKKVAAELVAGRKQGFCVIDFLPYNTPQGEQPPPPKYVSCRSNQGISVAYADVYHFTLDCQWIDVTDVKPGNYVLEDEVNPERLFEESNYANNASAIPVVVPARQGRATAARRDRTTPATSSCESCSDRRSGQR